MRTAHVLAVAAALASSAILFGARQRGGSARSKLCRAAIRRKLHPNPRRPELSLIAVNERAPLLSTTT